MWFVLIILKGTLLRWSRNIPSLNKLSGQKFIKFFLWYFGKLMISWIHSDFIWPLIQTPYQELDTNPYSRHSIWLLTLMYFREHSNPLRHADIHSAQLCDLGTSQKKLLSYICRAVGKPEKLKGGGGQIVPSFAPTLLLQPKSRGEGNRPSSSSPPGTDGPDIHRGLVVVSIQSFSWFMNFSRTYRYINHVSNNTVRWWFCKMFLLKEKINLYSIIYQSARFVNN